MALAAAYKFNKKRSHNHGREGGGLKEMEKSGMLDREVEPKALDE
jgi:hypothetical protein